MNQSTEKERIIRELIECQQRIKELESPETQQKASLLEARAEFENLFESSPEALIVVNTQGYIARMNVQAERLFGYARQELVGQDHGVLVPDLLREKHETQLKEYMKHPRTRVMGIGLELSGRRKDGTEFPADIDLGPIEIGQEFFVVSVVRDATKRKALEDKLVESEKRFRTTLDGMLEGCQIISFEWRYAYINDAAARQGHQTREALLSHTMMEMYPGIENTEVFARLRDCMQNRLPHKMENEFTYPDGSKGWFQLSIQPVPEGIFILSLDITQRKKLEEELDRYRQRLEQIVAERTAEFVQANEKLTQEAEEHRKAEEGLLLRANILDNAREAMFLINPEGDFVYVNEAAIRTYGYSRDEFLGMNMSQLLRPEEAPVIPVRLKEVLRRGQMEFETIHVNKDKSLMPVQVRHSLIKTLHGQFIVSVIRDITNEFRLRTMVERMSGIVWVTDNSLTLTASTGMALETLGLKPDEGIGMPLAEYLERHEFGVDALTAHQSALAGTPASFQIKDKKLGRTFLGWAAPLPNTQGKITGSISVAVDITKPTKHQ